MSEQNMTAEPPEALESGEDSGSVHILLVKDAANRPPGWLIVEVVSKSVTYTEAVDSAARICDEMDGSLSKVESWRIGGSLTR